MLHTFGQNCWWKWRTCEWSAPATPAASCTWRWNAPQNSSLPCFWKCLRIRKTGAVLHTPPSHYWLSCHPVARLFSPLFVLLSVSSVSWGGVGFLFGVAGGQLYTHGWKHPFNAGIVTIAICSSVLWCECFDSLAVKIQTDQSHSPALAWSPAQTHRCLENMGEKLKWQKINWPPS